MTRIKWTILLLIVTLSACKKSETIDTKELFAYASAGSVAYNVVAGNVAILRNEMVSSGTATFPVLLSRAFEQDISVNAQIDTMFLKTYDSTYKVVSPRFTPASFKINKNAVTIKAGETASSDSILVSLSDTTGLDFTKTYVVPVRLSSVGYIPVSNMRNVMYVKISITKVTASIPATGSNIIDVKIAKSTSGQVYGISPIGFGAALNQTLSMPVVVSVATDASSIPAFNSANNTSYVAFPEGSFGLVKKEVVIPAGTNNSGNDNFKVELSNIELFTLGQTYLLPIKIKDEGIVNVGAKNMAYIRLTVEITNLDPSNGAITGSTMNRTLWSVSTGGGDYLSPNRVLDGNNGTAWDSKSGLPQALTLNMGAVKVVKGFQLIPSYQYPNDNFINMEVYSSNDGIIWNLEGRYSGTPTSSHSSATNPDVKTVAFLTPVTAQYFKFNVTKSTDGSYAGMAELNGVE